MSFQHELDPYHKDYNVGKNAEQQFYAMFKAKYTGNIRAGNRQEDWQHADYVLGSGDKTRTLDVKARKFVDGKYAVWIEIVGYGRMGWIYGDHDYVAFQKPQTNGFVVVGLAKLRNFVKEHIKLEVVNTKEKAWGRCYMRNKYDRSCDVLALTTWSEIEKLKDWEL